MSWQSWQSRQSRQSRQSWQSWHFWLSKPCASTACWFARGWASAARGCRGGCPHRPGGARRRAGPCAAAGAGARDGRVGSEERGVPECCRTSGSRDQVWGCHVTPASWRSFSWSLHPCCLAPLHPSPRPPFLSPLVAPTPTAPAVPALPSQGSPGALLRHSLSDRPCCSRGGAAPFQPPRLAAREALQRGRACSAAALRAAAAVLGDERGELSCPPARLALAASTL